VKFLQQSLLYDRRHVCTQQDRVRPHTSAVNMTLPAFAAVRRAAAPLLTGTGASRCRSMSPTGTALSSKHATRSSNRWDRQRQTDGQ